MRGLSPSGDWGSYPKNSCISAFFINSSLSRLCGSLLPSRLAPCHLPLGGKLFGTATSKAPSLRGLSPLGDWGSHPKYSCISAFFITSSFSRLCGSLLPSRLAPCHLPLGGKLFGTATSKAPSLRGLSPLGDWGSHPKYSCISAFFISSSFSRLCCTVCFCWSTRSTKAANCF